MGHALRNRKLRVRHHIFCLVTEHAPLLPKCRIQKGQNRHEWTSRDELVAAHTSQCSAAQCMARQTLRHVPTCTGQQQHRQGHQNMPDRNREAIATNRCQSVNQKSQSAHFQRREPRNFWEHTKQKRREVHREPHSNCPTWQYYAHKN